MKKFFSIEGNIGAGKSTIVRIIKELFKDYKVTKTNKKEGDQIVKKRGEKQTNYILTKANKIRICNSITDI